METPLSGTPHLPMLGADGSTLSETPPSPSVPQLFHSASSSLTHVQLHAGNPPRAAILEDLEGIEETIHRKHMHEEMSETSAKISSTSLGIALGCAIIGCFCPLFLIGAIVFGAIGVGFLLLASVPSHIAASNATLTIEAHAKERGIDPESLLKLIERREAAPLTRRSIENLEKRAGEIPDNSPIKEDLLRMLKMSQSTTNLKLQQTYRNIAAYMIEKTALLSATVLNDDEFNQLLSKAPQDRIIDLQSTYDDYQSAMQKFKDDPNDKSRFATANDLFHEMNDLRNEIEKQDEQERSRAEVTEGIELLYYDCTLPSAKHAGPSAEHAGTGPDTSPLKLEELNGIPPRSESL